MTKKDFRLLAYHLRNAHPSPGATPETDLGSDFYAGMTMGWEQAVSQVADALQSDNPRFRRDLFLVAAGYTRRPDGAMYIVSLAGL